MTSKEALEQFLQSFLEKCKDLNDNDDMYYKNNLTSPYYIIKKDLEVLEILIEAYRHAIWELDKYSYKSYFIQDGSDGYREMEITKEQYDLINQCLERWLDGKD